MTRLLRRSQPYLPLVAVLIVYAEIVYLVNPLRETAFSDDWSYALTVKNFLATGAIQPHQWMPANIPVHIVWGALFSLIGGYSFVTLRFSTLVLLLIGGTGFYGLALEHRFSPWQAGLLTLMLLGSPFVLAYGFTFMTDAPFLVWIILGLYFYTRGLRTQSGWWMFAGALASSTAILTRPFAIGFVPALLYIWWRSARDRKHTLQLLICGLLPALVFMWQIYSGRTAPTTTSRISTVTQMEFLKNVGQLLPEVLWRSVVILEYMALFLLPLVWLAVLDYRSALLCINANRGTRRIEIGILVGLPLFILAVSLIGWFVLQHSGVMPILGWDYYLVRIWAMPAKVILTAIMIVGAFTFGRLIILRYVNHGWENLPYHEQLLDIATLFFVLLQFALFQYADRYLFGAIPFMLIVIGRPLAGLLDRRRIPLFAVTICLMLICGIWIRGVLSSWSAMWEASDRLIASGVPAGEIVSSWEWMGYHGSVDDYLKHFDRVSVITADDFNGYFKFELPAQTQAAHYRVGGPPEDPAASEWQVVFTIPYEGYFFTSSNVYVLKRVGN